MLPLAFFIDATKEQIMCLCDRLAVAKVLKIQFEIGCWLLSTICRQNTGSSLELGTFPLPILFRSVTIMLFFLVFES